MIKHTILIFMICTALYAPTPETVAQELEGKKNLIPVAIIGSGPAGLSAAIAPTRAGYYTVIFQGAKPGGELTDATIVENMPGMDKMSGQECMEKFETQVRNFGAQFVPQTVTNVDFSRWPYKITLENGTIIYALTVILATGASQKKSGLIGENKYSGKGLFSCGICDGSYTKNKNTVVIGRGDIAIQRVLQLAPLAKTVTLVVPGKLTASKTMMEKLSSYTNITILLHKKVEEIKGDDIQVDHILVKDLISHKVEKIETSSVFLSTGLTPNTELFKNKLELDAYGCIKLIDDRSQKTSVSGVMAAGCVADPTYRQIGVIVGEGTKAGIDAVKFLNSWGFDGQAKQLLSSDLLYTHKIAPLQSNIAELKNARDFRKMKRKNSPLLVEFYSPTCSSCQEMETPLRELAQKYENVINILKINRAKFNGLAKKNKIHFVPAFLLYKNGEEIKRLEGSTSTDSLSKFIKKALDKDQIAL